MNQENYKKIDINYHNPVLQNQTAVDKNFYYSHANIAGEDVQKLESYVTKWSLLRGAVFVGLVLFALSGNGISAYILFFNLFIGFLFSIKEKRIAWGWKSRISVFLGNRALFTAIPIVIAMILLFLFWNLNIMDLFLVKGSELKTHIVPLNFIIGTFVGVVWGYFGSILESNYMRWYLVTHNKTSIYGKYKE